MKTLEGSPMLKAIRRELKEKEADTMTIVVTKFKAMVPYLQEKGILTGDYQVVEHVKHHSEVQGRDVIGVLPNYISCHARTVMEIPLVLPPELRGSKELTLEEIKKYAKPPVTYVINRLKSV